MAKDIDRRVKEHNNGNACRYTKYRCPVKLIHKEEVGDYANARLRERQVKKFSRSKKLALISDKKDILD
ncbi:MAG: GIY-YIG nuclease family protein [Candidatus Omnitrophota bacterium]